MTNKLINSIVDFYNRNEFIICIITLISIAIIIIICILFAPQKSDFDNIGTSQPFGTDQSNPSNPWNSWNPSNPWNSWNQSDPSITTTTAANSNSDSVDANLFNNMMSKENNYNTNNIGSNLSNSVISEEGNTYLDKLYGSTFNINDTAKGMTAANQMDADNLFNINNIGNPINGTNNNTTNNTANNTATNNTNNTVYTEDLPQSVINSTYDNTASYDSTLPTIPTIPNMQNMPNMSTMPTIPNLSDLSNIGNLASGLANSVIPTNLSNIMNSSNLNPLTNTGTNSGANPGSNSSTVFYNGGTSEIGKLGSYIIQKGVKGVSNIFAPNIIVVGNGLPDLSNISGLNPSDTKYSNVVGSSEYNTTGNYINTDAGSGFSTSNTVANT